MATTPLGARFETRHSSVGAARSDCFARSRITLEPPPPPPPPTNPSTPNRTPAGQVRFEGIDEFGKHWVWSATTLKLVGFYLTHCHKRSLYSSTVLQRFRKQGSHLQVQYICTTHFFITLQVSLNQKPEPNSCNMWCQWYHIGFKMATVYTE